MTAPGRAPVDIAGLKRITIPSGAALASLLRACGPAPDSVMVVTSRTPRDAVAKTDIAAAAEAHGWRVERRHTLGGGRIGTVIRREG